MTALRALLLLALLDASCAFSMQQPTLVSRGRAMPQQKRLVHSLRMQEEAKPEEAAPAEAPAPVDFTPAAAPVEEEKTGFDPTQYSITISIFVLFCIVKAFSYFGIIDFDD